MVSTSVSAQFDRCRFALGIVCSLGVVAIGVDSNGSVDRFDCETRIDDGTQSLQESLVYWIDPLAGDGLFRHDSALGRMVWMDVDGTVSFDLRSAFRFFWSVLGIRIEDSNGHCRSNRVGIR